MSWIFTSGQLLECPSYKTMEAKRVDGITAAALHFIQ